MLKCNKRLLMSTVINYITPSERWGCYVHGGGKLLQHAYPDNSKIIIWYYGQGKINNV